MRKWREYPSWTVLHGSSKLFGTPKTKFPKAENHPHQRLGMGQHGRRLQSFQHHNGYRPCRFRQGNTMGQLLRVCRGKFYMVLHRRHIAKQKQIINIMGTNFFCVEKISRRQRSKIKSLLTEYIGLGIKQIQPAIFMNCTVNITR